MRKGDLLKMHDLDMDAQLSPHFKRKEFLCQCKKCNFAQPDSELLIALEQIRTYFNKPVLITSACRCESHNAKVGGAPDSAHKQGIAADIVVKDVSPAEVQSIVSTWFAHCYGIGSYNTFTHIDVRHKKARWPQ
jgi:uncharacterized protein YcbK (DUF882 family)